MELLRLSARDECKRLTSADASVLPSASAQTETTVYALIASGPTSSYVSGSAQHTGRPPHRLNASASHAIAPARCRNAA